MDLSDAPKPYSYHQVYTFLISQLIYYQLALSQNLSIVEVGLILLIVLFRSYEQGKFLGLGPCIMDSIILLKEVMKLFLHPKCLHVKNYYYSTAGLDTPLLLLYLVVILHFLMRVLKNLLYVMHVNMLNIQEFPILVWV